jgi:MFS family permease
LINIKDKSLFGYDSRVILLGVARMADAFGNSFLIVVLPLYIASKGVEGDALGLSKTFITGIILGLFGLITSIAQPFTGRLSDKVGKRKLFVVIGLALFTVANYSYSIADSYILLLIIRTAQGIAAAFTITSSLALITELSNKGNRGKNTGIYNSFRLVGFGVGPLLSGILTEGGPYHFPLIGEVDGFTASFGVASLAALVSALLVGFFVSDPDNTKPSTKKMKINLLTERKGYFLDPIFALALATLIMSFGFSLLAPIETAINERLSQGAFMFSIQFSALIAMLAVTQPIIGNASDKYGRRIFIIIGLIGLIPIILLEGFVTESWQLIVARALQGISAAMVFAPSLALAGDLAEEGQRGSQLAVVTMAFGLGISLGSFVSGYAIKFGYAVPFVMAAILSAIGVFIVKTQVPKKEAKVD